MIQSKNAIRNQILCFVLISVCIFSPGLLLAQTDYYIPKALHIPLHNQKNQLHTSLGWGGGYDLNLSYSLTNHLSVFSTANFDNTVHSRQKLMGDRFHLLKDDYVFNAGLGYFSKIDNPLVTIIEAYIGAGTSKVDNYWHFPGNTHGEYTKAQYRTAFVQLNAGKKVSFGELAFGIRVAYSKYSDFGFYSSHPNTRYITKRYEGLEGMSADPAVSYSYLWKGFKLNAQVGGAIPVFFPSTKFITTHSLNDGDIVFENEERNPRLYSLIGRICVQYNLNLGKKSNKQQGAY